MIIEEVKKYNNKKTETEGRGLEVKLWTLES